MKTKLVIYLNDARLRQCEAETNPIEVTPTWFGLDDAELYGRDWARIWQDDIVMLVEEDA